MREQRPASALPRSRRDWPERLGDYAILGELGRGAMGRVYRACQISLDRIVALKIIASGEMASPHLVERFRVEAEAAASLDHPHIVPIFEVAEQDEWHFFSMRLVEGGTLGQTLAKGRLPFERGARLIATIGRAIQHAHERGVLHRDIKPGNIMLDAAGEPHVTDFGLARFTERESHLTLTRLALGTPSYMAPEQAAGRVEWQQAEDALAAGRTPDAMATFARFLRESPDDRAVASRLLSLLERRAFPLPVLPPFPHGTPVERARMDTTARRLFTIADDGVLRAWSLTSGVREAAARLDLGNGVLQLLPESQRLLARTKSGRLLVWDWQRWQLEHELGETPPVPDKLSVSDDGRMVALVTAQNELELWETGTGRRLARGH